MTAPRLVVTRAPLRVSFVGGGSDLPPSAGSSGVVGAVVSSSLDKFVWCLAKPRDDGRWYLSWREKEIVDDPAAFRHEIVRRAFAHLTADGAEFPGGVELAFVADVPGTGSGLGSSAATAAACLLALDALAGGERYDGIHGRRALAERSVAIQPVAKSRFIQGVHRSGYIKLEPSGGKQDEYATVYGGLNAMRFTAGEIRTATEVKYESALSVDLSPLGEEDPGAAAWLEERFALFRPPDGAARSAADVLATYKPEHDAAFRRGCIALCDEFIKGVKNRAFPYIESSIEAHSAFKEEAFGGYSSTRLKIVVSDLANVGACAVKLCGAGGTGHLLVGFEPERRAAVVEAAERSWGPELKFKLSSLGASVVYREVP